jgi:hypothetical protein
VEKEIDQIDVLDGFMRIFGMIAERSSGVAVERVGRMEQCEHNVGVSTVYVSDLECFETALLHGNGEVSPVERYGSRPHAQAGHDSWCERAKAGITRFTKLGWGSLTPPEEIEL